MRRISLLLVILCVRFRLWRKRDEGTLYAVGKKAWNWALVR
jgi:hypothetical protein